MQTTPEARRILSAVESVAGLISKPTEPQVVPGSFDQGALAAIDRVVSLVRELGPAASKLDAEVKRALFEVSWQSHRVHKPPQIPEGGTHSILRMIGRHYDENLHSDFLAALLRTETAGDCARQLFSRLLSLACGKPIQTEEVGSIIAYREVRLDHLEPTLSGTPLGARRLDVLARSRAGILVIESKVWTTESETQTADYHAVLGRRYPGLETLGFLLLSPDGKRGQDRAFRGISFAELFEHLGSVRKAKGAGVGAQMILGAYVDTLCNAFAEPDARAHSRSRESLRKEGFRV